MLGEPQVLSGRVRKIPPPPGFHPRTVQPVVSRCTDCAIAAHILVANRTLKKNIEILCLFSLWCTFMLVVNKMCCWAQTSVLCSYLCCKITSSTFFSHTSWLLFYLVILSVAGLATASCIIFSDLVYFFDIQRAKLPLRIFWVKWWKVLQFPLSLKTFIAT